MLTVDSQRRFSTYFRILDFIGGLLSNDEKFVLDFRQLYYEGIEPVNNPNAFYSVSVDRTFGLSKRHSVTGPRPDELLLITPFYPSVLLALERSINQQVIRTLRAYCLIQGGFITFEGIGLLIVGGYETGRHLLIKTLTDRGCTYFGDSISILNIPQYEALCFPKSIAIKRSAHSLTSPKGEYSTFRDRDMTCARYVLPSKRAQTGEKAHRIDFVLFPNKDASGDPVLKSIDRAGTLMRLMENTFNQGQNGEKLFEYLAGLARETQGFCVNIRGLKKTTDLIFRRVLCTSRWHV